MSASLSPRARTVAFLPIGHIEGEVPRRVRMGLCQVLGVECAVLEFVPRPLAAYDYGRAQYRASAVLARAARERPAADAFVFALFAPDLFEEPYNFTFGEVDREHGAALLSLARLQPAFYGEPDEEDRLVARAIVEAVYQLGRLLGLGTCDDPTCPMTPSNGTADVDAKQPRLCPECEAALDALEHRANVDTP